MSRSVSKRIGWAAIAVISAVLLTIGASRDRGAATTPERVRAISATTKCPVCVGESVGQSNAPASLVIKEEIARLVSAGRSDDQVRADILRSYPDAIQLTPPATGAGSIVWILPIVLLIAVGARLFVVFRRERV